MEDEDIQVMQDIYETDGKELPHEFSVPVGDNVLTATRTDPYGFWSFSFKRGRLPKELEGSFSSDQRVKQAVNQYLANRKE